VNAHTVVWRRPSAARRRDTAALDDLVLQLAVGEHIVTLDIVGEPAMRFEQLVLVLASKNQRAIIVAHKLDHFIVLVSGENHRLGAETRTQRIAEHLSLQIPVARRGARTKVVAHIHTVRIADQRQRTLWQRLKSCTHLQSSKQGRASLLGDAWIRGVVREQH
jgi:hypothetical protein